MEQGAQRNDMERDTMQGPVQWIRRFVDGLHKRPAAPALAPEGQRSGAGADSVQPYLEQGRSTRPSPLE